MRKLTKNYGFGGQKEAVALRKRVEVNFLKKCTRGEMVNSALDLRYESSLWRNAFSFFFMGPRLAHFCRQ